MKLRNFFAGSCIAGLAIAGSARADVTSDLKAQMDLLQKQLDQVKTQLYNLQQEKKKEEAKEAAAPFIRLKPNAGLTFEVGGGEVQLYGHADVSVDYVDNGLSDRFGAVGKNGWLTQEASNLSFFGIRGSRQLTPDLKGVFQFETEVAYVNTPGPTSDSQVKQGLGSRNSFVGLQGSWGAVKIGKTDAPYKTSTGRMDPFSSTVGDYNSIIGNTGGDNRAEFDTRLSHSIWYESPKFNGLAFGLLISPGQNRSNDNSIVPRGEPICNGGNDGPCTDGSNGTIWSTAVTYTAGPLYAIVGYEHHKDVNRSGDELGGSDGINPPLGAVGVGDESAWKVGVQYNYKPSGTTASFIYERAKRGFTADAFNERTRNTATWLALSQKVTPVDDVNFGWAHAGKTPGTPGGPFNQPGTLLSLTGPIDNEANLYALGYKHHFADKKTTVYAVAAEQKNHSGAHYDLGASGHGNVIDCHDAAGHCFTGTTIKGISVGITYDF